MLHAELRGEEHVPNPTWGGVVYPRVVLGEREPRYVVIHKRGLEKTYVTRPVPNKGVRIKWKRREELKGNVRKFDGRLWNNHLPTFEMTAGEGNSRPLVLVVDVQTRLQFEDDGSS